MSTNLQNDDLAPLQQALRAIKQLRQKLDGMEKQKREPIAIIGMGCRLPGGIESPDAYWQMLRQGVSAIAEIPSSRWDVDAYYDKEPTTPGKMYTRHGGFMRDVDTFDTDFFSISPAEAATLDPQQRLLLEVSWEALEDAGQDIARLRGSGAGVFIGLASNDYERLLRSVGDLGDIDAYAGMGNLSSVAAGRLSYLLGLHGPNMVVDTACSSSLVSLHIAVQSLRAGECDLALAGGVSVMAAPENFIYLCKIQALSPDGQCKTFDASANGYVRGEGCGMVILKRLSQAEADGDRILAVIRGSAVNHGGRANGLSAPNGLAQRNVIRAALSNAGVTGAQVGYVEAHGTGTALGDPIEAEALGSVMGEGRNQPLVIGSVKTNIGHLEAAAGIAGLMKVVLVLQHGEIPPHLNFKAPSPYIDWARLPLRIPTELMLWKETSRLAGVSSFGMSGTNAHLILEQPPSPTPIEPRSRSINVLTLSAKSETALAALAGRYRAMLTADPSLSTAAIAHNANVHRSAFPERAALVHRHREELLQQLTALENGQPCAGLTRDKAGTTAPRIAFLFTGQGAFTTGISETLLQEPAVRDAIAECERRLAAESDVPDLTLLLQRGPTNPVEAQVGLFVLQYALVQLWHAWGVSPSAVCGHSLGEYAAACTAGILRVEDALTLVLARARGMAALPAGNGTMLAVFSDAATVEAELSPALTIAAFNGPNETIVAGARPEIDALQQRLQQLEIESKRLDVTHAFHSAHMDPMLGAFADVAAGCSTSVATVPFVSAVSGVLEAQLAPDYWTRQIRQPVRFLTAAQTLAGHEITTFLEIGPRPVLTALTQRVLDDGTYLASLRPGQAAEHTLLQSVGQLYVQGTPIAWAEVDRAYPQPRVALPTYPFQRKRYWPNYSHNFSRKEDRQRFAQADASVVESQTVANPTEATTQQTVTSRVLSLLSSLIGIGCDQLQLTQQLRSTLNLDSLGWTELTNRLKKDYPGMGSISNTLFVNDITVGGLINYLERNVASSTSQTTAVSTPSTELDDRELEVLAEWEREFNKSVPRRIDKKLVHKHRDENVLIARISPIEVRDNVVAGEITQDVDHEFFYEHSVDHVPGMYILEACRQFTEAMMHVCYEVPFARVFVLNDFHGDFRKFAELDMPLFVLGRVTEKIFDQTELVQVKVVCDVIQKRRVIARVKGEGTIVKTGTYSEHRKKTEKFVSQSISADTVCET